jgi:hypothetical protein
LAKPSIKLQIHITSRICFILLIAFSTLSL